MQPKIEKIQPGKDIYRFMGLYPTPRVARPVRPVSKLQSNEQHKQIQTFASPQLQVRVCEKLNTVLPTAIFDEIWRTLPKFQHFETNSCRQAETLSPSTSINVSHQGDSGKSDSIGSANASYHQNHDENLASQSQILHELSQIKRGSRQPSAHEQSSLTSITDSLTLAPTSILSKQMQQQKQAQLDVQKAHDGDTNILTCQVIRKQPPARAEHCTQEVIIARVQRDSIQQQTPQKHIATKAQQEMQATFKTPAIVGPTQRTRLVTDLQSVTALDYTAMPKVLQHPKEASPATKTCCRADLPLKSIQEQHAELLERPRERADKIVGYSPPQHVGCESELLAENLGSCNPKSRSGTPGKRRAVCVQNLMQSIEGGAEVDSGDTELERQMVASVRSLEQADPGYQLYQMQAQRQAHEEDRQQPVDATLVMYEQIASLLNQDMPGERLRAYRARD